MVRRQKVSENMNVRHGLLQQHLVKGRLRATALWGLGNSALGTRLRATGLWWFGVRQ